MRASNVMSTVRLLYPRVRSLLLLRDGHVLASGATTEVLTTGNIASLYGVVADVTVHPSAGHIVVVPIGRTQTRADG